jgi:hypothetical protein
VLGACRWVTYASVLDNSAPANMTVVFETMAANATQSVAISLGLNASACATGLVMWSTNATTQFAGPVPVPAAWLGMRNGSRAASSSDTAQGADVSSAAGHISGGDGGCAFSLELPPASIITVTTSTAGSKLGGKAVAIPPSDSFLSTFEGHYNTSFDERAAGAPPYYFSDEGGA